MQELHTQNLANSDITTLLLNCYAKLKDTARLDDFIATAATTSTGELPFDLETAIRVCRQAGYFDHAVALAEKFNLPEEFLRIQIEDREQWLNAISYIRTLGQEEAESNLKRYGKALLTNVPEQATEVFIDLCCGTLDRPLEKGETVQGDTVGKSVRTTSARGSYFSYLALNRSAAASSALPSGVPEAAAAVQSSPSTRTNAANDKFEDKLFSENLDALRLGEPELPDIRQFFALFVDQPACFIRLLETVAKRRWARDIAVDPSADSTASDTDEEALWNTLLELYLSQSSEVDSGKALRMLKNINHFPIDPSQALLACTVADYVPGLLAVYEHLGMYEDIMHFWMDQTHGPATSAQPANQTAPQASEQVVAALDKFGPAGHPDLYPLALRYLTSDAALLSRHQQDLLRILDHIDKEKLMPPIAVIQALSKTEVATIGLVKDYLRRQIAHEQEEVDADRALTESYRTDIARKEGEIAELSDQRAPRVFQVTRCNACGGSLDLPAVHFMCRHSYHQRCLADNEGSCPACASQQGVVMEIKQANENLRGRHDLFLEELEESDDRFDTIVGTFGRGLVRPVDE